MEGKMRPYNGNNSGAAQVLLVLMTAFGVVIVWGVFAYMTFPREFLVQVVGFSILAIIILGVILWWITKDTEAPEE
jgi:hypothetical protein